MDAPRCQRHLACCCCCCQRSSGRLGSSAVRFSCCGRRLEEGSPRFRLGCKILRPIDSVPMMNEEPRPCCEGRVIPPAQFFTVSPSLQRCPETNVKSPRTQFPSGFSHSRLLIALCSCSQQLFRPASKKKDHDVPSSAFEAYFISVSVTENQRQSHSVCNFRLCARCRLPADN